MIRALSPYYLSTPLVSPNTSLTCTSYTLHIKVWSGLKTSVPTEDTYRITKDNTTASTGSDEINIARIISDFIEFIPQSGTDTAIIDGNNQMWVQTYTTYQTTDEDDATDEQNLFTDIMCLGYSYGYEGKNNDIVNESTLIPTQEYKVYRNGYFIVPILLDETGFTSSQISVKSYPNGEININQGINGTLDSNELVKYVWVNLNNTNSDRFVEVFYNDSTTTLFIEEECKYTPINIAFQNKDGAEQIVTFFKEKVDSMSITSSEFERASYQAADGYHQFVRYDVQGRTSFKANSGYIDEDSNEVFRQLLLSEKIWLYDGTRYTPINIKSNSITYKTRQKERLINYELNFDMSYNEINNI